MMATRTNQRAQPVEETPGALGQVAAREVSKAVLYLPPWMLVGLLFGLGWLFHVTLKSDDPQVIAWTTAGITACVLGLTGLTWQQSHARSIGGRLHTTLTTLAAGMWVCAATINGPDSTATGRIILIGGVTLAVSFNIRTVIRVRSIDVQGIAADPLKALFGSAAAKAGMPAIEARTTARTDHKVEAVVQLEAGKQVADDLARKVPYIESGMSLPPGSITTSVDPDDASKAHVVVSDPRVMKRPLPWPGPSRPGASIAEALRIGLWQDLDDVLYVITGHHLQLMGMSGAGKSIGGCWNILGEAITRADVAVFAADVTKLRQTLGPLDVALHRFETTEAGVRAMLRELQAEVKNRTDQLSERGLTKWKPGCGLTYWIIWLEECPDILDALSDDEMAKFLSLVKALRSGGGTVVLSLQRSDYTQMPTIARGQLGNMCFGVANTTDASFGLSEAMDDAGARPELWENGQPGMAYLGAPTIPRDRIAMPLRTFAWGVADGEFDDQAATAALRAHAALYPAAAKQVDPGTAALARLGAPTPPADTGDEEGGADVENVAGEYLQTEDPDPSVQVGMDDEIPDLPDGDPPWRFGQPEKMTPEQRGAALMARLQELWDGGARDFSSGDFKPLWESTDMSRSWVQNQLKRLAKAGVLGGYDDDAQRYLMPDRPEV
ncbi:hypothetical protein [Acrocarpospora sp. B8E8]|uniref:hypothetical protein n=1 Tax=Acrocarpospora sp. B8E8 TaxID=3153572 RepID=UPI00325C9CF6